MCGLNLIWSRLAVLFAGHIEHMDTLVCGVHLVLATIRLESTSPGCRLLAWTLHSMKASALATAEVLRNMNLPGLA
jgi:hypothetical protein